MRYTVQLLPPDYIDTDVWPQVAYLFYVDAETGSAAVVEGKLMAHKNYNTNDPNDWFLQFLFKGHLEPEHDLTF